MKSPLLKGIDRPRPPSPQPTPRQAGGEGELRRLGRFELAHGGSIFLDEIGAFPLEVQAKLLRVLQEGELERVGGTQTIRVDVRVIAVTKQDLMRATHEARFRQDLYSRLHVFPIQLPSLRDRQEERLI